MTQKNKLVAQGAVGFRWAGVEWEGAEMCSVKVTGLIGSGLLPLQW